MGWRRDKISAHFKAVGNDLLRKAYSGQTMRETGIMPQVSTSGRLPSDDELLRRGLSAQMAGEPHSIGSADLHQRTEFGDVETREHGRLRVAHDRTDGGTLIVHDIAVHMEELDRDLRESIVSTSAAFSVAASATDQTTQRAILGTIMSEVLARPSHRWFADKVKERVTNQRYYDV